MRKKQPPTRETAFCVGKDNRFMSQSIRVSILCDFWIWISQHFGEYFSELFKADDPGEEIRHCASRKLLYHDVVDFGNVCGPPGGENAAAWHICHVPDLTRESSTRRGAPAKLTPYQQSICIFNLHVYRAVPGELCITALTASCVLWFIPCAFCRYSRLRFSRWPLFAVCRHVLLLPCVLLRSYAGPTAPFPSRSPESHLKELN